VALAVAVADVAGLLLLLLVDVDVIVLVVAVDLFSEKPGAVYPQAVAYGTQLPKVLVESFATV